MDQLKCVNLNSGICMKIDQSGHQGRDFIKAGLPFSEPVREHSFQFSPKLCFSGSKTGSPFIHLLALDWWQTPFVNKIKMASVGNMRKLKAVDIQPSGHVVVVSQLSFSSH